MTFIVGRAENIPDRLLDKEQQDPVLLGENSDACLGTANRAAEKKEVAEPARDSLCWPHWLRTILAAVSIVLAKAQSAGGVRDLRMRARSTEESDVVNSRVCS